MTSRFVFAALCFAVSASALSAQGWPGFRGAGRAGAGAGSPPTTWDVSTGTQVAWRTEIPGMGHSSPIVSGDRVFVTTAIAVGTGNTNVTLGDVSRAGIDSVPENARYEWRLMALNRVTGNPLWSTVAHTGVPRIKRHVKASHASATPATDGQVVVALMGSEGLYCFSATDGSLRWKVDVGLMDVGLVDDPTYQWGPASSPVIAGNLVLVQNDRHTGSALSAYDLGTGKQVWTSPHTDMPSWATPVVTRVGARSIVVTSAPTRIRAHDLSTGQELWHWQDGTQVKVPSPVIAGNNVIITGGYAPGSRPTWAIPLASEGAVTANRLAWTIDRGSPYTSTPLVYDELLYMVTDSGILSAYDAATGDRLYQQRLAAGAGISASPVAAGGRVYFATEDGDVLVVSAGRTFELLATNSMGEVTMATPAVDGNTLFVRTIKHLVAISTPTSEVKDL
jgi:outer membrane protein assembly factor BamB